MLVLAGRGGGGDGPTQQTQLPQLMEIITTSQGLGCDIGCDTTADQCQTAVTAACENNHAVCSTRCKAEDATRTTNTCATLCENFCAQDLCGPWQSLDNVPGLSGITIGGLCPSSCDKCTSCNDVKPAWTYDYPMEPNVTLSMMKKLFDTGQGASIEDVHWGSVLLPLKQSFSDIAATVLYNSSATHAVPTFLNAANNALRERASRERGVSNAGKITVSNEPFANTTGEQAFLDFFWYILITLILMTAFAFVPAAVVAFPVMEAEAHHNSRHQQYISGVSIPAYWLSNYVWDLFIYCGLLIISGFALKYYEVKVFTEQDCSDFPLFIFTGTAQTCPELLADGYSRYDDLGALLSTTPITCDMDMYDVNPDSGDNEHIELGKAPVGSLVSKLCPTDCNACGSNPFWVIIALFTGYGMSVISATYLFSFVFKKHSTAQLFTLLVNIVLGMILVITSYIMHAIGLLDDDVKAWNENLVPFFRLSPGFSLGNGIFNIASKPLNDFLALAESPPRLQGPRLFQWEVAGADVTYLFVTAFIYLGLVMVVDYARNFPALINKIPGMGDNQAQAEVVDYAADPDVRAEEERVRAAPIPSGLPTDDVIFIRNLRKVYGGTDSTKWLGFGLGQLFGFSIAVYYLEGYSFAMLVAVSLLFGFILGGGLFYAGLLYTRRKETSGTLQKGKVAVRSLTLGLPKGDCFGFLGTLPPPPPSPPPCTLD